MELTLNEVSFDALAQSHKEAKTWLDELASTCVAAARAGGGRLRMHESLGYELRQRPIALGYTLGDWLRATEDHDLKSRMRSMLSHPPLIESTDPSQWSEWDFSEYEFADNPFVGQKAHGLGAAHYLDGLGISIASNPNWRNREIGLIHRSLNLENVHLENRRVTARNASDRNAALTLINSQRQGQEAIASLWQNREKLLPNLEFCGRAPGQITLGLNDPRFKQVAIALLKLQSHLDQYPNMPFDPHLFEQNNSIGCSKESEQTMTNYGSLRRFSLNDGRREVFELHLKLGSLRLHFYEEIRGDKSIIHVGYIGAHLRTWTN